ncbi:hypothetical protein [Halorubrum sp. DTA98]|uniref:hypothetical protein n=1 Tax=Halorubrum sp. DTA98 TaxID=3402163 RepID=UPI003AB0E795
MEPLIKILVPSGIGILIVFLGVIDPTWEKGSQIAAGVDMAQLGNLLGDWVVFGLLIVIALVLLGVIQRAAGG